MECRNCDFWGYEDSETNGAGKCKGARSSNYGCWTYPDDGCIDDNGDLGCIPVADVMTMGDFLYLY